MAVRKPTKREKKAVRTPTRLPAAPLSRLKRSLDVYEYTAADEILAGFHLSKGMPVSRDPDLGIPSADIQSDAADAAAARQYDLLEAYDQWRNDLHGTEALAIVDAVILNETMRLLDIDAENGKRKGSAREALGVALRHFAWLRAPRRAPRDWKYTPKTR